MYAPEESPDTVVRDASSLSRGRSAAACSGEQADVINKAAADSKTAAADWRLPTRKLR
jgi:hypothetical protein